MIYFSIVLGGISLALLALEKWIKSGFFPYLSIFLAIISASFFYLNHLQWWFIGLYVVSWLIYSFIGLRKKIIKKITPILIGQKGVALTEIRIVGKVEVEKKIYEAVTKEDRIDKNSLVEIVGVIDQHLVVKMVK